MDGVKVLDLSRVLAGPYCTALLADMGADVVKVEAAPSGDDARHLGPFLEGESVYFAQLNRGKRSVVLDLKTSQGQATLQDLATKADVVVENFRPGVASRLGADYTTLSANNPRLIYLSISGFGQSGPLSSRGAYDLVVQAMSGLMAATGQADGPPTRVGESMGDLCAALFGTLGISAALFDRERTGAGRVVDVAMLDSLIALQVTSMSLLTVTGGLPGRIGNRHPISTPFDTYATSDGLVAIAVANDAVFERLCRMIDRTEVLADERFASDPSRTANLELVRDLIELWTKERSVADIVSCAEKFGVPAAPIWDLKDALSSEQVRSRELVGTLTHPDLGALPFLRQPIHFGDPRPIENPRVASLGEHNVEVLNDWLDYPDAPGTHPVPNS